MKAFQTTKSKDEEERTTCSSYRRNEYRNMCTLMGSDASMSYHK